MNFFFLSILAEPPHHLVSTSKPFRLRLRSLYHVAFIWLYFAFLLSAPTTVGTQLLIPLVLVVRLLLFFPYAGFRVDLTSQRREGKERTRKPGGAWKVFSPSVLSGIFGYASIWLSLFGSTSTQQGSWSVLTALFNDSAISALGFDLLLALVSVVAWFSTGDENLNLNE